MIIEPYTKRTETSFQDLDPGECYRLENGDSVYMKLKNNGASNSVNTVSLASGCTFKHNNYYKVFVVNGKFVEEK